jgi:hypothetical protein
MLSGSCLSLMFPLCLNASFKAISFTNLYQNSHSLRQCYDLNMKCPPQVYVLGTWLLVDGLLGSITALRQ